MSDNAGYVQDLLINHFAHGSRVNLTQRIQIWHSTHEPMLNLTVYRKIQHGIILPSSGFQILKLLFYFTIRRKLSLLENKSNILLHSRENLTLSCTNAQPECKRVPNFHSGATKSKSVTFFHRKSISHFSYAACPESAAYQLSD